MSKKIILLVIIIIIIIGIIYWGYRPKEPGESTEEGEEKVTLDPQNCTYTIEGKNFTLKNGYSEEEIVPGSASKIITQYFGNEASGDLNGDGFSDTAFIITQNQGGSGTFYYVVVALGSNNKCEGTNAIFLGDRIAPQTTEIEDSKIIVNYADRKMDESMVTQPSIAITRQFIIEDMTLKEITPDEAKKEQACLIWGGSIETSLCCLSAEDFPDTCLIGACGCSPENSHEVKTCDCGLNMCFNGEECVVVE